MSASPLSSQSLPQKRTPQLDLQLPKVTPCPQGPSSTCTATNVQLAKYPRSNAYNPPVVITTALVASNNATKPPQGKENTTLQNAAISVFHRTGYGISVLARWLHRTSIKATITRFLLTFDSVAPCLFARAIFPLAA